MKNFILTAALLLCAGAICSCEQRELYGNGLGKNDAVGTWYYIGETEYYFDGQRFGSEPDVTDFYIETVDGRTERIDFLGTWIDVFDFQEDNGLYIWGTKVADWRYERGRIILSNERGDFRGFEEAFDIYLSNGRLYFVSECLVYGYYNEDDGLNVQVPNDGEIHTYSEVNIYERYE